MKELLKKYATKKNILIVLGLAPLVGIAVNPEFAESFSEHLAGMLQLVIDALPASPDVPAE